MLAGSEGAYTLWRTRYRQDGRSRRYRHPEDLRGARTVVLTDGWYLAADGWQAAAALRAALIAIEAGGGQVLKQPVHDRSI